jgi:hypothetical protein
MLKFKMTVVRTGLMGLAILLSLTANVRWAHAQLTSVPPPPPVVGQGIEVLVTPYLWIPWTSVGVRPGDTRIPSKSTTIDPGQLFGHLTWVPFMGEAEFRDGPYGVVLDYIHAPLTSGVSTRNILFSGANAGLTLDSGTAMFLYRPIVQPDQYLDVGLGVRAWGVAGDISLNQGLLPAVTVSNGLAWADPLIAVRYHRDLGNGFGATAYGDVGGFGVGAHIDWQLVGTIDYAWRPGVDLHAGMRDMGFSFGAPRANINMNMYGPIISATFRF